MRGDYNGVNARGRVADDVVDANGARDFLEQFGEDDLLFPVDFLGSVSVYLVSGF